MNAKRLALQAICIVAGLWLAAAQAVPVASSGYEVSLFASGIGASAGMRAGADGNLYVADYGGGRILRVDATGAVTVLATGATYATDVVMTSSGRLFSTTSTGSSSSVVEVAGGALTPFASGFSYPTSIAAWGDTLFVANSGSGEISRVTMDGTVSPVLFTPSSPNGPFGLSFDSSGRLHYIDHGTGGVYRYDFNSAPEQIASVTGYGGTFTGFGFDDDLFFTDVDTGSLYRLLAGGTTELVASDFAAKYTPPAIGPQGIAYFGGNDLFVADGDSIWRISRPAQVPEPETLGLLAIGLAGLVLRRRRLPT